MKSKAPQRRLSNPSVEFIPFVTNLIPTTSAQNTIQINSLSFSPFHKCDSKNSPSTLIQSTPHHHRHSRKLPLRNPLTRSNIQPTSFPLPLQHRIPREVSILRHSTIEDLSGEFHKVEQREGSETCYEVCGEGGLGIGWEVLRRGT